MVRTGIAYGIFFLILCAVSLAPLFANIRATPQGTVYSRFHGDYPDYYTYLSYIHQGRTRNTVIYTYTTEEKPATLHWFYMVLGKGAAILRVSDSTMYWISIIASLAVFYAASVVLIRMLLPPAYHIPGMILVFLASPPPNITIPLLWLSAGTAGWTKMDAYSRLIHVPHHFAGIALMLAGLVVLLRFVKTKKIIMGFFSGVLLAASIAVFVVPGFVLCISLCLACLLKIPFRSLKKQDIPFSLGMAGIIALMAVTVFFMSREIAFSGIAASEYAYFNPETYPFLFTIFLSSYGILLPFSLPAIFPLLKRRTFAELTVLFMMILPVLLYCASAAGLLHITKIRFIYTAPYVFAGLLATMGIQKLREIVRAKKIRRIAGISIALIILANAATGLWVYWVPKLSPIPPYQNIFIPARFLALASFLETQTVPFPRLLAVYTTGTFLPAYANVNVFAGHPFAYTFRPEKRAIMQKFTDGTLSTEELRAVVATYGITYVLWEREPLPAAYGPLLKEVFRSENLVLYMVVLP